MKNKLTVKSINAVLAGFYQCSCLIRYLQIRYEKTGFMQMEHFDTNGALDHVCWSFCNRNIYNIWEDTWPQD